jgi:PAS domain S-box-containing protein
MRLEVYDVVKRYARVQFPAIAALIGLLVLAGWQFNLLFFIRPIAGLDAMNPLSAVAFIFAALSVWLLVHKPKTGGWLLLSRLAAIAVLLIGLLRGIDLLSGNTLNADQWLFAQKIAGNLQGVGGNRMGYGTILALIVLGLALFLTGFTNALVKQIASIAAFLVMATGLFFLLGYLYRVSEFYNFLLLAPMSVQSALCFALLGRATLGVNDDAAFLQTFSSPYMGGIIARRLVPVIIIAPVVIGFIGLWNYWIKPFSVGLGVAMLVATIVSVLFGLIWFLAARLNASDSARTQSEAALKEFNKNLEAIVAERTEKVLKLNRLYSFLSAINQSIVHTNTPKQLLENICQTASSVGQFKMAWASMVDKHDNLNLVAMSGPPVGADNLETYMNIDYRGPAYAGTMIAQTMLTGKAVVSNDVLTDPIMKNRWAQFEKNGINSSIALPLKKFGKVVGLMGFHSTIKNFFDEAEIALLQEAANDASFALEYIDKENLRLQAEARLKRAQEVAHVGHWDLDFATGQALWSEEACRIYGLSPADNLQSYEVWKSLLHPDDEPEMMRVVQLAQQTHKDYALNHRIVWRDGSVRYVHSESKFEFDEKGNPTGLYGVVLDITDISMQQEAIRKSEANLSAIIENTDAFIFSMDKDLRCLTFNSNLKNILQQLYGFEIKAGVSVYDFLKHLDNEAYAGWARIYTEALNGKAQQFVKKFTAYDSIVYTSFSINPIYEGGKIIGVSSMGRDITAQKLAEQEIINLNESLEQKVKERTEQLIELNKELETFSATVSHDLQAPLRSINGFSKILITDYKDKLDKEGQEFLGIIETNVRRMSDLIRDLLDFSRLGKQPMKIRMVDMTELAETALREVQDHTADFNAQVNLQPLQSSICDPALMLQVWTNLISNAVKYSGKQPQPQIEIGMLDNSTEPVYYIKDNGVGFNMDYAEKLFQPFMRMHSKSDFEGTGVGLTTAYRIINRHGGRIWADSKPNQGATFYFTLP